MSQLRRASGVAASNAVLRTKRSRALVTRPNVASHPHMSLRLQAKGTALRRRGRANCVRPASADLRFGKQAVSACMPFERENRVRGVTLPAKKGHSEMTSNASKYKCGRIAGRAVGVASRASTEHP